MLVNILKRQKILKIAKTCNISNYENKALIMLNLNDTMLFKLAKLKQLSNQPRVLTLVKNKITYLKYSYKKVVTITSIDKTFKPLLTGILFFQFFKRLFMLIPQNKGLERVQLSTGSYAPNSLI